MCIVISLLLNLYVTLQYLTLPEIDKRKEQSNVKTWRVFLFNVSMGEQQALMIGSLFSV